MRVLIVTRAHIGIRSGGIYRKIMRIVEGLKERGVTVELYDPWRNSIPEADIIHCFTTYGGMYPYVEEAKRFHKPVVISPVFAPFNIPLWQMRLRTKSAIRIPGWLTEYKLLSFIFEKADAILPLHDQEAQRIAKCFNVPAGKLHIVPNGTEKGFLSGDPDLFRKKYGLDEFVLQVGSLDMNKNQITLIQAMKELPYSCAIVGGVTSGYDGYAQHCYAAAGQNVIFTGHIDYGDPLLASAFMGARVFVLPSFSEVMPQVLYQAMQTGCHIVVSRNVPVYREVADKLFRFNPKSSRQLSQCIERAMHAPRIPEIREFALAMPSWGEVVDRIFDIYKQLMSKAV